MKRAIGVLLIGVMLLGVHATARADATANLLMDVAKRASGALAIVHCVFKNEAGTQTAIGPAICVDASGVLVTLAIDPRAQVESMTSCEVILPGIDGTRIAARLLGVDPLTGLGFVQTAGEHKWTPVQFEKSASLVPGQLVVSVGLMSGQPGFPVYLGMGYISAVIRTPGELAFVTGGELTGVCSPVFSEDGKAIGLVGQPLFSDYQVATRRGPAKIAIQRLGESSFFMPAGEFAPVLASRPSDGKVQQLSWIGVPHFEAVTKEYGKALKLDVPGIVVDKVVSGRPAAAAGIKNQDIIVAMNDKRIERLASPLLTRVNFVRNLARLPAGTEVNFGVLREGKVLSMTVKLEPMPTQPNKAKRYVSARVGIIAREKVELDRVLDTGPTAKVDGMILLALFRNSPAHLAGLQAGDVITAVDGKTVTTAERLKELIDIALARAAAPDVVVTIRRGNQGQSVTLKVPPAPVRP